MSTEHTQEITRRFDLLASLIEAEQITRNTWRDAQGRACLLLALAPEIESPIWDAEPGDTSISVDACPSWLLPPWLVYLTPWIDDEGTREAWPATIRRYADVVGRAARVLDAPAWRRCEFAARVAILEGAREYAPDTIRPAIELCARAATGDEPRYAEWGAARDEIRCADWPPVIGFDVRRVALVCCDYDMIPGRATMRAASNALSVVDLVSRASGARAIVADQIIAAIFDALEREIARAS